MNIAVLGTGSVGQAVAGRLAGLGHQVTVGTRDPEASRQRTGPGDVGRWLQDHPEVALQGFATAAAEASLVVNATTGAVSLDVLEQAGSENLAGVVVLDLSNPLDFSQGFPPSLSVCNTDSLAEQIQRAHPAARVVKALNTLTAELMVHPDALGEPSTVFVAGDDESARAEVRTMLEAFGHTDILDLGGLAAARGMEMWLPLWAQVYQALGSPLFNLKIVR